MDFSVRTFAAAMTAAMLAGHAGAQSASQGIERVLAGISWLGQSSVRIEADGKVIYVDPLHYRPGDKADLILITHTHQDHYVRANVEALTKTGTVIVAPSDLGLGNKILKPGQSATVAGFAVEAVPAYNAVKTQFHPKSAGYDGYIITVDGVRVYHAGDTERIPEMKNFRADIAMLPLGQTYTFNSVDEAVQAALDTGAKIAIPIHWGTGEGKPADAKLFADELGKRGVSVRILEK
jgi:L-ascorbate metabolism protein UlaG (beta-lactamase superfamily)